MVGRVFFNMAKVGTLGPERIDFGKFMSMYSTLREYVVADIGNNAIRTMNSNTFAHTRRPNISTVVR